MPRCRLFAVPTVAAMIGFIVCLGASWIIHEACLEHGAAKWRMNDLDCTHYFPPGSSSENWGELDKSLACWFSDDLYAMGEPSLRSVSPDVEAYRFTWVPTFKHPLSVRVERRGASVILVATELDGRGGYEAGKVVQRRRLELASAQWNALVDAVNRSPLWTEPESPHSSTGLDGEEMASRGDTFGALPRAQSLESTGGPSRQRIRSGLPDASARLRLTGPPTGSGVNLCAAAQRMS